MGAKLGAAGATGLSLYEKALNAPSCAAVDEITQECTKVQGNYLNRFDPSEFYKAYSTVEDTIITSQGAEIQTGASLRSQIRSVEPQKILHRVVTFNRQGFLVIKRRRKRI